MVKNKAIVITGIFLSFIGFFAMGNVAHAMDFTVYGTSGQVQMINYQDGVHCTFVGGDRTTGQTWGAYSGSGSSCTNNTPGGFGDPAITAVSLYPGNFLGIVPMPVWIYTCATFSGTHDYCDTYSSDFGGFMYNSTDNTLTPQSFSTKTRIINIDPQDGQLIPSTGTTTPVDFNLHAYISPDDFGTFAGIKITFENIDQNVILSKLSRFSYTFIDRAVATSTGNFYFSTTTLLGSGNYRVTATLERTTLFGVINPFSGFLGVVDELSHQFVVGTSTWVGNMQQNMFKDTASFYGGLSATSSAAQAEKCNPVSGQFDARQCIGFLLIPDTQQLSDTFSSLRDGVLVHVPWGYVTRFTTILASTATTSFPTVSVAFNTDGPLAGASWDVNPGEMFSQGADLIDSIHSNQGHTVRDIFEPWIKMLIGIFLIFQIIHDITGSHKHMVERDRHNSQRT